MDGCLVNTGTDALVISAIALLLAVAAIVVWRMPTARRTHIGVIALLVTVLSLTGLPRAYAAGKDACNTGASSASALAVDDSADIVYTDGVTVSINVLANDTHSLPVNIASIDIDPSQTGVQQTLTNSDGTWSVQSDGKLEFAPAAVGVYTTSYTFRLTNGLTSNVTTVTVNAHVPPPVAEDDYISPGVNVDAQVEGVVNIVANDTPDPSTTLDLTSVDLDPQQAGIQQSITSGNTTITYDPTTGDLTYFASSNPGAYPTITYTIADGYGRRSNVATVQYALGPSDVRLKRNIRLVGYTATGINLYAFQYLNSDQEYVGVLAQEILASHPAAVETMPDGYYIVNYRMLGVRFMTLEQWLAQAR